MPNELSINPVAAATGPSENPAEPQAESFTPPAHAPPAQSASPNPNPQLRLDPALGLVVIEFRDNSGTITTSIPSQRQLEAYRMWEQTHAQSPNTPETLPHTTGGLPTGATVTSTALPNPAATQPPAERQAPARPAAAAKD